MPIKVDCPQCHKALNAPDGAAGRTASCPQCKSKIKIPSAASAVNPPPAGVAAAKPSRAVTKAIPVAHKAAVPARPIATDAIPMATAVANPVIINAPPMRQAGRSPGGLDPLPALDPLGGSDPFGGLSIDALGGMAAAGGVTLAPLAGSTLAAPARRRTNYLVPAMIIAGAVLVTGLVIGGVYLLAGMMGGGGDWMKFMPDDAQMIVHVDMDAVRRSGLYERVKRLNPSVDAQLQQGLRGTALRFDDISKVSVGGSFQGAERFVAVIETNRSISEGEVAGSTPTRQEQVGEYTLYYEQQYAGARINGNMVVSGTPDLVKAVLARNGPPKLPPVLQSAVDEASFSWDVTLAMSLAGLPRAASPMPGTPIDPNKVESVVVSADLGSSIEIDATVFFTDAEAAGKLKQQIDQQMAMMQQFRGSLPPQAQGIQDVLDSLSISQSGRTIRASLEIPQSVIDQVPTGMGGPAPGAGAFPNSPKQSPSRPNERPRRGRPSEQDSNLPPLAPSRGLF